MIIYTKYGKVIIINRITKATKKQHHTIFAYLFRNRTNVKFVELINPCKYMDLLVYFIQLRKIEKFGLWEELNNENFNFTEYREIKINEIGTSSYTMSPKQWIQRTNANCYSLEINMKIVNIIITWYKT